jgi:hypothetical protein
MVERIEAQIMSDGERVQQLIYDWLERNYPDEPTWFDRSATEAPALEIKMIPAFGKIEYNLSNGGWAQFLWNCFGCWRDIINIAREGYLLIGAPEQSVALTTLWTLCKHDERECGEMHKRAMAEFEKRGPTRGRQFSRSSRPAAIRRRPTIGSLCSTAKAFTRSGWRGLQRTRRACARP